VVYTPENTTQKGVTWETSDATVATVLNGTVTAMAVGNATITARSTVNNSITATCPVTVTAASVPLVSISLDMSSLNLTPGGTGTLTVNYNPSGTTQTGVTWSSSPPGVVTVSNGTVTAVSVGTATITATGTGGKTATCLVEVTETQVPLVGISLNKNTLALDKGETDNTLIVIYNPSHTTESGVTWSTSDVNVATVHATTGFVTAVGAGKATITATSTKKSAIKATCAVTVTVKPLAGISLDTTLNLDRGTADTLAVTYNPSDTTEKGVTWSSDDPGVATVDPTTGLITAIAEGTTTITATSTADNSKIATCEVTVIVRPLTGIILSDTALALNKGGATTLSVASYSPPNTTETGVTWSSSDDKVAMVNTSGRVTAVGAGSATIIATSTANPAITATYEVTVTVPLTGISLPATLTLGVGSTYLLPVGYNPVDATETELAWSSDNTSVATVYPATGFVTADATNTGTAIITAKSIVDNSIIATCVVTVQTSYNGAGVNIVFEGPVDETITLLDVVEAGLITITAPGGYERYLWYLDYKYRGETSDPEVSVPIWNIAPGLHYLTVIVQKDGNHFSKTLAYRVGY
jgi:uncharacterized protein YjdB